MEAVKAFIGQVDDDYLIGLSNKGILKRAYKDLEQEAPAMTGDGEEIQVALKEETCRIRLPLGESSCSCPSRSMCRHVMTAILWLRKSQGEERAGDSAQSLEAVAEEETQNTKENAQASGPLFLELLEISPEKLKKACGARRYRQLLEHIRVGELPRIEESSIVTVWLPWEQAVVKLLEPLEYSTCTCHRKELCSHKAQALLAYQLQKGQVTLPKLAELLETESSFDEALVEEACRAVREAIEHQMNTGMCRQSPETAESLERLALISHRAGLARMESGLREAANQYRQYFERSAAFRDEALWAGLLSLYERVRRLECAKSQEEISALSGSFRDTYELVGNLRLMGIGARSFSSKTGYAGEIYYFLDTENQVFYTWTDARPVFYEGVGKRARGMVENSPAPWGLGCSREQMMGTEFRLKEARAAFGGRLSASQETKGEILGKKSLESEAVQQMIAWDYESLLGNYFKQKGQERLALVGAAKWGESSFDQVQQRFSWSLFDREGRALFISLRYTREERLTIQLLERLEQRLQKKSRGALVFFGFLYLEEGRLCLYPIEFFQQNPGEELGSPQELLEKSDETQAERVSPALLKTMERYERETVRQLTDLFSVGLFSLQEGLLDRLEELGEEGERLGLHVAGEKLFQVGKLLREKRHQMEFDPRPVLEELSALSRYLKACQERLSFERARGWQLSLETGETF
ncbi:MAG: hypothetical protein HFI33_02390 [Lachnospiraceae bacterium]|nr:hypothetical protein [Lachnospiraceae bacterium]